MSSPVRLAESAASTELNMLASRATELGDDVSLALTLAVELGRSAPAPGSGRTLHRWDILATLGAADLTAARVVEPHLDAVAILDEAAAAGMPVELEAIGASADSTWGVFAAEGPGVAVRATRSDGRWTLRGTKPWCSLADRLSHALITAHTDGGRALFAVSLRDGALDVPAGTWAARGLTNVPSGPLVIGAASAVPVGPPRWYLERPGFAWGGIGVAAVWHGGAVGVARRLFDHGCDKPEDPLRLAALGAVDTALTGSRSILAASAGAIDRGTAAPALLAARVRGVVAAAAELTLLRAGHTLGPAALALEETHARRVADLTLYLRQHHAERDDLALGTTLVKDGLPW
ncbi:acyl-CoA dehydrogenase [Nakamurella deserti]|uniref:acyl-CoA dehydrogenase n=1 Tax=Nakamurella deserti TaxID=2164074 RepID=UPI000DBE8465|nr:acyl-CoA dehydrogenase [Nakamurella deserti]